MLYEHINGPIVDIEDKNMCLFNVKFNFRLICRKLDIKEKTIT